MSMFSLVKSKATSLGKCLWNSLGLTTFCTGWAQNAKPHCVYIDRLDRRTETVCEWLWKATKFHLQNKQQLVRKPCGKATRAEFVRDSDALPDPFLDSRY